MTATPARMERAQRYAEALHLGGAGRSWWWRLRERLALVLLLHPGEFAEFVVGFLCLVLGLGLSIAGSPISSDGQALAGGLLLSVFAVPQMVAAILGHLRSRHWCNVLGCGAALGNLIRSVHADAAVASALFGALFATCLLFWVRGAVQLRLDAAHARGGAPGVDREG